MAFLTPSKDHKAVDEYLKKNIAYCEDTTMGFDATDSEILYVILDYITHPDEGVRRTAKRTGHSKTWVWKVLHHCPTNYDDKLAKLVYTILYSNNTDHRAVIKITSNEMTKLLAAKQKLAVDRDSSKHITKLNAKFLLWF